MKVAIVAPSPIPFLIGGAEKLFMGMFYNLNKYTPHNVELIKVPVRDQEFWGLIEGYRRFYHYNLEHFDIVIATKYPAWMVGHKNRLIYMQHPCRGVYELYRFCGKSKNWRKIIKRYKALKNLGRLLEKVFEEKWIKRELGEELIEELFYLKKMGEAEEAWEFPGALTRAIIKALDRIALEGAKYAAISKTVALRKGYFPQGAQVKIIYHPTNLEGLCSKGYEYIFTVSRLEGLKRIDLLIKAYKKVKSKLPFLIAGTGGQEDYLKELAREDKRIKFLGFVSDEELIELYSKALFVPFVPYEEDYGLITLEAMQSEKTVLTVEDAGGPVELVEHGKTGLVIKPEVEEVASAMQWLVDHKDSTIEMGRLARERTKHINWENFCKELLGEAKTEGIMVVVGKIPLSKEKRKKKLLVLSPFSTYPLVSGGRLRLFYLYRSLSDEFEIIILSPGEESKMRHFSKNFFEIVLKKPSEIYELGKQLEEETGVSSEDLAMAEGWKDFVEYRKMLEELREEVSGVVLYHPYLIEAIKDWEVPVFYDAPDIEVEQKKMHYNSKKWVERVRELEREAVKRAKLIWTPSREGIETLVRLYGIPKEKVLVVENGVDVRKIRMLSEEEKKALKQRLGIRERIVAVFAGSYHPPNIKALSAIIDIAKKVKDVLFLVIGDVCLGVEEKKIPDNLLLMGRLKEEEKDVLFKASDIGLNPVESGSGTNVKLAEYMAYGLIVITTVFGKRGYEIGKKEGVFVAEVNEFPKVIKELAKKKEELSELRNRAREYAEKKLSWENMGEKLRARLKAYFYRERNKT